MIPLNGVRIDLYQYFIEIQLFHWNLFETTVPYYINIHIYIYDLLSTPIEVDSIYYFPWGFRQLVSRWLANISNVDASSPPCSWCYLTQFYGEMEGSYAETHCFFTKWCEEAPIWKPKWDSCWAHVRFILCIYFLKFDKKLSGFFFGRNFRSFEFLLFHDSRYGRSSLRFRDVSVWGGSFQFYSARHSYWCSWAKVLK